MTLDSGIIATTIRLDPPLDRPPEELLRTSGISVELEGRRVRLDPDNPRSSAFARILDGLSKQRLPVYVEVDSEREAVTRILVPLVGRVVGMSSGDEGIDVELDTSHARHVLPPDSGELEAQLRKALDESRPVILAEDDAHRILNVRVDFTPDPDWPLPPFPPGPPRKPNPKPWLPRWARKWLWLLCCRFCRWFRCLSPAKAQQVFDAMAATTCAPLTVPPPCIPFMYPDDGCWARAHEMCRLMINMGLSPRKVWIDHSSGHWLHVNTRNNPQCYVEWGWHVAPILCVRGSFPSTQLMVIDPSLFTTPVSEGTWKGVQGDANATLTETSADVFWHGGGTDPNYTNTNAILAQYRLALQTRALQVGPPPYANCP